MSAKAQAEERRPARAPARPPAKGRARVVPGRPPARQETSRRTRAARKAKEPAPREIGPQEGPQEAFSRCTAEILIYGGQAGGGKSWGLVFDPLRYIQVPEFEALIFRRTLPEIKMPGGLWDSSRKIYQGLGAEPNISDRTWTWEGGGKIGLRGLQYDDSVFDYQGSEIPWIGFDELTHFTEAQFLYMLSRNRSPCGVPPQVRASTNPDSESWVKKWIQWWIDPVGGLAIPERSGVIRYVVRTDLGEIKNFATREEAQEFADRNGDLGVKELTFIHAALADNKILQERDPNYEQNLKLQDAVQRARLLGGNWNVRYEAGKIFKKAYFKIMEGAPAPGAEIQIVRRVRYWDLAGTEDGGDYTVGLLMGLDNRGCVWILDVIRGQWSALGVVEQMQKAAGRDGVGTEIWTEQEPGSSGKFAADSIIRSLRGFIAYANKKTGSKLEAAKPLSAQAEAGNVFMVRAEWNDAFLSEMERFAGDNKGNDDQVDAASGAFSKVILEESTMEIL